MTNHRMNMLNKNALLRSLPDGSGFSLGRSTISRASSISWVNKTMSSSPCFLLNSSTRDSKLESYSHVMNSLKKLLAVQDLRIWKLIRWTIKHRNWQSRVRVSKKNQKKHNKLPLLHWWKKSSLKNQKSQFRFRIRSSSNPKSEKRETRRRGVKIKQRLMTLSTNF